MQVGVIKETFPGERRVALIPADVAKLAKHGLSVIVESGAGAAAGFLDRAYDAKGAKIAASRDEVLAAEIVVRIRTAAANQAVSREELPLMRPKQIVIGQCDPLGDPQTIEAFAKTGVVLFALELMPRTTRAQSMDILSSMATIAGYRAVLLGAVELPKIFPLMMTAAGTLTAARVFIIGVGVAGLSAIATARRLGAVVRAYDVRPACREQVESLGGKFVELPLETAGAEAAGGYAKAQDETFYIRQRELLANVVGESDVVITTAAIPGKPSPLLVTEDAVRRMQPGGVIVDLAAERGGNCALTKADERVIEAGVTILGPTNLASEAPQHASQMFSSNVTAFLLNLVKEGVPAIDSDDEIIRETLIARDGVVVHGRLRDQLGLGRLESQTLVP